MARQHADHVAGRIEHVGADARLGVIDGQTVERVVRGSQKIDRGDSGQQPYVRMLAQRGEKRVLDRLPRSVRRVDDPGQRVPSLERQR